MPRDDNDQSDHDHVLSCAYVRCLNELKHVLSSRDVIQLVTRKLLPCNYCPGNSPERKELLCCGSVRFRTRALIVRDGKRLCLIVKTIIDLVETLEILKYLKIIDIVFRVVALIPGVKLEAGC